MVFDMVFACWSYSCYLTLKEWQIVVYLVMLAAGVIQAFCNVFGDNTGTLQQVGLMVNICFYVFAGYYVGRKYYFFRLTGGIHGTGPRENLLEDKIYNGAADAVAQGGNYMGAKVNEAMDKDDAK
mmetsp:Transcript_35240/g.25693  ORF Transcript_35240/g.25693 Transcript_35240/m.25693 type:complete len:125 (+) Transcript_35240:266-640(+)|eukprot:CAMPEP_0116886656 /NCGR_PEP_ID=MMETSP0463-20121206/20594_1 /TAXON_ID=181622 /ORGANISM="Strombidinopsis sp, Strain SopsisLIS2011" /LENGTH=124 /DNA_ID=CAMNT_0004547471 /DNA_START=255 /DNA_END=629 /DNA_ORIENTATION=+